jgi:hypothetical protein
MTTTTACKHPNVTQQTRKDLGLHVIWCDECKAITHACFEPLPDEIEKGMEEVRRWGQHYAKSALRVSDGAVIAQKNEKVITDLRTAMMQHRMVKNEALEVVAELLDEKGMSEAAMVARSLKLEISLK